MRLVRPNPNPNPSPAPDPNPNPNLNPNPDPNPNPNQGDFVSTPKITEFVALGAAGGCLPVLVLKGEPHNTLPYMRWLDWCEIAWVVNASRTKYVST